MPAVRQTTGNSDARDVQRFSLQNGAGFEVGLLDLGASIQSIRVPAPGGPVSTVLGYADTDGYLDDPYYMGSTVGRYANRIGKARFELDGRTFELAETPGGKGHCLHGGPKGFSQRFWEAEASHDAQSVRFRLESADGDQGFPGRVKAAVTYRLLDHWQLVIEFRAETDAPTVVNLANHAYFNLNGDGAPVDNHWLLINADRFTPLVGDLIPSGEIRQVHGSAFDFREPVRLAECFHAPDVQLRPGGGVDQNFVLNRVAGGTGLAAILTSPQSGLVLKIHTTQPGLQCYTGQYLREPFLPHAGVCLEVQGFPNAPNTPGFPATVLRPGMVYRHRTVYAFSVAD